MFWVIKLSPKIGLQLDNGCYFISGLFAQVKFRGVRGRSWTGDIAIHDVLLTPGSCPRQSPSSAKLTADNSGLIYNLIHSIIATTKLPCCCSF